MERNVFSDLIRAGFLGLIVLQPAVRAEAAFELLPEGSALAVFGNGERIIHPRFHNPAAQPAEANLRFRLYQGSGSTLMPLGEVKAWKTVKLHAGQTVLESAVVELPMVRGETEFYIVWYEAERRFGTLKLKAFPEQLLRPLIGLAGEKPIGLLDPEGKFRSALAPVARDELKEAEDITGSESRLILIAPMSKEKRPAGLATALKKKAAAGAAIVWIQSPLRQTELLPDAYVVEEGAGRVVVAAATTVDGLADSPRAQLNLLRLAELATGRRKLELPADPEP